MWQWYKYGKWSPNKRTDAWVPLKKPWKKPWSKTVTTEMKLLRVGRILNYMSFWKSKIENEDNIRDWVKPWMPMTIVQACREVWITSASFHNYVKDPEVKPIYLKLKEERREFMKTMAEWNISKALAWWMNIQDKELVDFSFRMLEKTDKAYNPKTEIDANVEVFDASMSTKDLMAELAALLKN